MSDSINDAVQDHYPPDGAQCYGCGRDNEAGMHLMTRWDGESRTDSVTTYLPRPEQRGYAGIVYGGLIASVMDCSGIGTAALAGNLAQGRDLGVVESLRYVTGTLEVRYLKPAPMDAELVCRGHVEEVGSRKVIVSLTVSAREVVVASGRVVAVLLPEDFAGPRDDRRPDDPVGGANQR